VEPNGPRHVSLPEVVDIRLFGRLRLLEPLVAWLLRRRATADLRITLASGDLDAVSHKEVISRVGRALG
jgi:hypothetical protein